MEYLIGRSMDLRYRNDSCGFIHCSAPHNKLIHRQRYFDAFCLYRVCSELEHYERFNGLCQFWLLPLSRHSQLYQRHSLLSTIKSGGHLDGFLATFLPLQWPWPWAGLC